MTKIHPWLSEYINFLKEIKDNPLFIFKGYVTDDELAGYYQQSKANILISRDEGYGYSYVEAKSQKCPSILSDIPIFREIAKNDSNVVFVNPKDPESIAKEIRTINNQ
jgi:glycosyltransferase involved in cell wall biosynthesis